MQLKSRFIIASEPTQRNMGAVRFLFRFTQTLPRLEFIDILSCAIMWNLKQYIGGHVEILHCDFIPVYIIFNFFMDQPYTYFIKKAENNECLIDMSNYMDQLFYGGIAIGDSDCSTLFASIMFQ